MFHRNHKERKPWPADCPWPEPLWEGEGPDWDPELAEMMELDSEGEDLKEIGEYMDAQVKLGRLNPDYSLNEDYEDPDEDDTEQESDGWPEDWEPWKPEKGGDYWEDGFDLEGWQDALSHQINLLKIDTVAPENDPAAAVRSIIRYEFINENLLRQAFTRRSFGLEYGLSGCSEELEFYGDAVLNTVVTRELFRRYSDDRICDVDAPFHSRFQEGDLSKLREKFVSREHLATRASELGLDTLILYGTGEEPTQSSREDMMEALIGAVAVDSGWDWSRLEDVADRLVSLQLDSADVLLRTSPYEQFNAWHQKRFGCMPKYEVYRHWLKGNTESFDCTLRFFVPENHKEINRAQRIDVSEFPTRSRAREYAAQRAMGFLQNNGLWLRLEDARVTPELENSINQLQELYQKKYLEQPPVYTFEERGDRKWSCTCVCDGFDGYGTAVGKVRAKKKAALSVLVRLMKSAGICKPQWEKTMWNLSLSE